MPHQEFVGLTKEERRQLPHPNDMTINQEVHQRLIDDREFNLLEENDQQVILAKAENNPITPPTNRGPSSFPTPPSGGRPSRPVTGVNPYRVPPKVVDQGLAGGGNGGGAAEFDDNNPSPKKEQKTFDYDYRSNDPKNKKKIYEQNKAGIDEFPVYL